MEKQTIISEKLLGDARDRIRRKLTNLLGEYKKTDSTEGDKAKLIQQLMFVDLSLRQLREGGYGFCLKCGEPINFLNLNKSPGVPFCDQHREEIDGEIKKRKGAEITHYLYSLLMLSLANLAWSNLPEIELPEEK